MKYTISNLLLCTAVLPGLFTAGSLRAQVNNKQKKPAGSTATARIAQTKTNTKKTCCECEYFVMCKYDVTKSFGGDIYKGLRNDDGSITYYNCDNGEVSMKWETIYTPPIQSASDYDPISNTTTTIYYRDNQQYQLNTRVFIKCNISEGTAWLSDGTRFILEKSDTAITIDGTKYEHVMVVREGTNLVIYYAKGIGKIQELTYTQYKADKQRVVFEKGTIDPDLFGLWTEDKDPGYWGSSFYKFNPDGTAESGFYNAKTKVFGKPEAFTWRMIDKTLHEQRYCAGQECYYEKALEKTETGLSINKTKYKRH